MAPRRVSQESCLGHRQKLVGPGRFELPTSRLSGVRSNQLSYGPLAARRRPPSTERGDPGLAIKAARPQHPVWAPVGD